MEVNQTIERIIAFLSSTQKDFCEQGLKFIYLKLEISDEGLIVLDGHRKIDPKVLNGQNSHGKKVSSQQVEFWVSKFKDYITRIYEIKKEFRPQIIDLYVYPHKLDIFARQEYSFLNNQDRSEKNRTY
jgi:hypothetical protein